MQVADEQTTIETVHAAYAAGINFFDVSPYYGSGRAEQVGRQHKAAASCPRFGKQQLRPAAGLTQAAYRVGLPWLQHHYARTCS
jgi:hypothetical protein